MGRLSLRDALDDGSIRLSGLSSLVRSFSRWFTASHFRGQVRSASLDRSKAS
jgi:hypothetical protein